MTSSQLDSLTLTTTREACKYHTAAYIAILSHFSLLSDQSVTVGTNVQH